MPSLPLSPEHTLPDEPLHLEDYRAIWHNRPFMCLWLAQVASQLADRVIFVVFIAAITTYYGAAESYTSYLYVAFTIPAIVLTALAGVFVDRWPRRPTLLLTNALRALCVLLIPLMVKTGLWGIYSLAFLLSTITQFFVPAESATIPCIVKPHQLLEANSMFTTTMMASIIFGFALGDPLIEAFGLNRVHWALFILFALATLASFGVTLPKRLPCFDAHAPVPPPSPKTLREAWHIFMTELGEGIAYLRDTPVVWRAMLKLALLFSAVVALSILAISYSKAFLYTDATLAARKFAFIITMAGVGMALGAGAVSTLLRPVSRAVLVYGGMGMIAFGLAGFVSIPALLPHLSTLAYALPEQHWGVITLGKIAVTQRMLATYMASIIVGIGAAWLAIPIQAFLHARIPEDIRGKVLGVQFTLLSTSSTLPALFAGLGTEWLGVRVMMAILALPFAGWALAGLWKTRTIGDADLR
jgi:MFS family permease